ncbi:hypothetical protein ABTM52_20795, partial [Acinetobacter baumannii]
QIPSSQLEAAKQLLLTGIQLHIDQRRAIAGANLFTAVQYSNSNVKGACSTCHLRVVAAA